MQRWLICVALAATLAACNVACRKAEPARKARVDQQDAPARTDDEQHARWPTGPICIDPGHGGRDSGTVGGDGTLEKTIALDVAKRVAQGLEANGAAVVMTRDTDRFVRLEDRVRVCNAAGAGLFVSIHANGFYSADVHGFELYYLGDESAPEAGRAAEHIRRALADAVEARDRGVRRADFTVLSRTTCPAVLVEVGYLSNRAECARLLDEAYRQRVADAIVAGIVEYAAGGSERAGDSTGEEEQ
jgi:N-acetylmuramoyl-L-alanine amidase